MKTRHVFLICATFVVINLAHDYVKLCELRAQVDFLQSLRGFSKPSVEITPEGKSL